MTRLSAFAWRWLPAIPCKPLTSARARSSGSVKSLMPTDAGALVPGTLSITSRPSLATDRNTPLGRSALPRRSMRKRKMIRLPVKRRIVQPTQETPLPVRRLITTRAEAARICPPASGIGESPGSWPSSLFPQSEISTRTGPMAGCQGIQQGPRVLIIAIALAAAIAAAAQAQTPSLPNPTPPSDFASVAGGPETFVQPTEAVPSYYAGEGYAPTAPIVQMGLFDTITESLCGQPDPNTWRPLPCSTFFSEGWNEAWVPSPNGSGGAPRQGWINAQDGNLYRLWFFTFAQGFNNAPQGNAYLGVLYAHGAAEPSRRADLEHSVLRPEQCSHWLAHHRPQQAGDAVAEKLLRFRRHLDHAPFLAARDQGFLPHGRGVGADPDWHRAHCGENRRHAGLRLLEQLC